MVETNICSVEFPGFSGHTLSAGFVSRLKLLGTEAAEITIAPRWIVEGIDVVGHLRDIASARFLFLFLDPLFFKLPKKDSAIPAGAK